MRLLWTEANGSDITKWEKEKWFFQKCHFDSASHEKIIVIWSKGDKQCVYQQANKWSKGASAWLTSRKLRPSHLMTSLNSIKLIRSTHFMTNRVWMALIRSVPNLQCFDYLMEMVKKSCLVSWWHRFTPHNDQWILLDFAQYTVLHGNTILRWLIILKQKNLKRKICDCFHFASFIFSSCLLLV